MKKLSYLAMAAIFALSISSCKKDRTCSCTVDGTEMPDITWSDIKKKDAKDACDAAEDAWLLAGADEASCELD